MPLSVGDRLGPYEILAPLGAGGMGEVYRARDPRLNRDVAIKVSKTEFGERFEREAPAVAALNHPNICTLYDVGPDYLVMEFVEGAPVAPVDSPMPDVEHLHLFLFFQNPEDRTIDVGLAAIEEVPKDGALGRGRTPVRLVAQTEERLPEPSVPGEGLTRPVSRDRAIKVFEVALGTRSDINAVC